MSKYEIALRGKIEDRKESLKNAIAATENFFTACDGYFSKVRDALPFDEYEKKDDEMILIANARMLSLRARLSVYSEFSLEIGFAEKFLDELTAFKMGLAEKAEACTGNYISDIELAILQEKLGECCVLLEVVESVWNVSDDGESQGGDA